MPWDANGFFKRAFKWTDDRDADIKIIAERMDEEQDGIVAAINDFVAGRRSFKGLIRSVFGTKEKPAYSFESDDDTGMFHAGTDKIGFSTGGETAVTISKDEITIGGEVVWHKGNADPRNIIEQAEYIPGDVDLNDYTTPGFFYQSSNDRATSGSNYPEGKAGTLIVSKTAGVNQLYQTYNDGSPEIWFRGLYNDNWSDWRKVWTDANQGEGSGLDADQLDGQEGSFYQNASNLDDGIVPVERLDGAYDIGITGNAETATHAASATNAVNAENAINATNAVNAANAENAVNADKLGDVPASNYARVDADEQFHGAVHFSKNSDFSAAFGYNVGATRNTYIGFYRGGTVRAGYLQATSGGFGIQRDGGAGLWLYGSGDARINGHKV